MPGSQIIGYWHASTATAHTHTHIELDSKWWWHGCSNRQSPPVLIAKVLSTLLSQNVLFHNPRVSPIDQCSQRHPNKKKAHKKVHFIKGAPTIHGRYLPTYLLPTSKEHPKQTTRRIVSGVCTIKHAADQLFVVSWWEREEKNGLLNIDAVSFSVTQSRLVIWWYAVTKSQISCGRCLQKNTSPVGAGARRRKAVFGTNVSSKTGVRLPAYFSKIWQSTHPFWMIWTMLSFGLVAYPETIGSGAESGQLWNRLGPFFCYRWRFLVCGRLFWDKLVENMMWPIDTFECLAMPDKI